MSFDIVIPVGPKDEELVRNNIKCNKKNIVGYRNIYLISAIKDLTIDGCKVIYEDNVVPFKKDYIVKKHGKNEQWNGWYYQQLIKLYVGFFIPELLDYYLVVDCDTFFIRKTEFFEKDTPLLNYSQEYHPPYFEQMKNMDSSLIKVLKNKSGICHHMMFQKKYVIEMMKSIAQIHKKEFFDVFLDSVPKDAVNKVAGASEYEIYFNYMLLNHPDKIKIRAIPFTNSDWVESYRRKKKIGFQVPVNSFLSYVSFHWHVRNNSSSNALMKIIMNSL
jgi:uncharacterized short protein YbdD (DUF466 family)